MAATESWEERQRRLNAERQRRYRLRVKEKLKKAEGSHEELHKKRAENEELKEEADDLASELAIIEHALEMRDVHPFGAAKRNSFARGKLNAKAKGTKDLPKFMGWTREEWCDAPRELVRHFKLDEAVAKWRKERGK